MKAIILWGRANTGKTTTLNLVIQNLLSLGATVEHDCKGNRVADRCLVLKYNGHRIAVCTDGDCESIVQRNFNDLKQAGATCDILWVLLAQGVPLVNVLKANSLRLGIRSFGTESVMCMVLIFRIRF